MKLVQLSNNNSNNLVEFVNFWSQLYNYPNEKLYRDNISKLKHDIKSLNELFRWKNGMRLSELKQKSLNNKILSKLSLINEMQSSRNLNLEIFQQNFKTLTAVWKIFLLHIIKPIEFPIYDQHIHRAYLFINNKDWSNISNTSISNKKKEEFYFKIYLQFIKDNRVLNLKKLDEAFFVFGQFLNTRNYSFMLSINN